MSAEPPLIVGAGPTGLAAALFLNERGVRARVVDALERTAPWSKALGVNPRTLDLLEPSGVTAAIVAEGLAVGRVQVTRAGRPVATMPLDYAAVGARHPLTILPQSRTEALLGHALARRGVNVERGVRLVGVQQEDEGVRARLIGKDAGVHVVRTPLLLAADGAHSAVRKALGIDFPGQTLTDSWTLADLALSGPRADAIHIDLQSDTLVVAFPLGPGRWRLVGIGPDALSQLPTGWIAGQLFWRSDFRISHRIAAQFTHGGIALAGDAAHLHSPIGARGMNLGIEDAWVWAACAADALAGQPQRLADYDRLRSKVDAGVVRRVRRVTDMVRAQGAIPSLLRRLLLPLIARTPALRHRLLRQVAGLDHAVHVV